MAPSILRALKAAFCEQFDYGLSKVKGEWKYYYRAVDKKGESIGILLTAKRDKRCITLFDNNYWLAR